MSDEIPEFGASVTFGFDGSLQSAEVHAEVPGAAGGSDPLRYEHDFTPEHGDPAAGPGWMPHVGPDEPPLSIFDLPAREGWHRDQFGIEHPDLPGLDNVPAHEADPADSGPPAEDYGPGDFPEHSGDEWLA
jgi:hypothetical protein